MTFAADGGGTDGRSRRSSISKDGSTISFGSQATNLVSGDSNGVQDIFVTGNPFFDEAKTTICHKGKNTITVSKKALPAHLAHGDTIGPCS